MKFTILITILVFALSVARAEDWTASDGTVYKGVKVLSHDDAFVTIMYDDGGARVPLRLLNADLQKQFGYNAAKAAAAEAAATAQDKHDRQAVIDEENAAAAQKIQQAQAQDQAAAQAQTQAQPPQPTAAVSPPSPQTPAAAPQAPADVTPPGAPAQNVDVAANTLKIQDDQEQLENVKADIRLAEKLQNRSLAEGMRHDSNGAHANVVGDNGGGSSLPDLMKKRADLTNEIADLQKQNAAALGSGPPPTQDDIDTVKQKIHDIKEDEETLRQGKVNGIGIYNDKLNDDISQQKILEGQLASLENRQVLPPLSQDDVMAIHEQIVQIESDIRQKRLDRKKAGAIEDLIEKSTTDIKIQDDNDQITDLRRKLRRSPRVPIKLSPDEIAEIQKKISDLQADQIALPREGVSEGGGHVDQLNEDAEQVLALQDELQHAK